MATAPHAPVAGATGLAAGSEPEALVLSYWFDSGESDTPYDATVRFKGRLAGLWGAPKPGETFVKDELVVGVVPRTGPVSITAVVHGLAPGEWIVEAERVAPPAIDRGRTQPRSDVRPAVYPAAWSWRRWRLSAAAPAPVRTRWSLLAPLASQPGVMTGAYPALAMIGFGMALALQAAILTRDGVSFGEPLAASVLALVAGLIGAKTWYAVLHPDEPVVRGGWAVDGFLVVAPLFLAAALFLRDLPIGATLDATAPGIFVAVAIGRIGCFVTGCCAGRPTASRWGIWSSDRRVGTRRIPTQLIESAVGLGIGVLALFAALAGGALFPGAAFLVSFALYTVARQVLLRLRAEQRRSQRTLPLTAAAAGALVPVIAILLVFQGF